MKRPMKLLHLIIQILVFLFALGELQAQKFGKIDLKRLEENSHPLDSKASHAYIVKNSYVYYDIQATHARIVTEYHNRIKIYDEEGVDQANIVRYTFRSDGVKEIIKNIKAECYNMVDGKLEKTKLSKREIFKEKIDENYTKISFAIPNVRPGSIIEFKYKLDSPFLYSFPRHFFQADVPVDYSQFKVDIPSNFSMAPTATGMIQLNQSQRQKRSQDKSVMEYVFDVSDVPGIADDKYVLNIDDYRSSLKFELSQVAVRGQSNQEYTKDWNSICKNLMDAKAFGGSIKKDVNQAEELLSEIAAFNDLDKIHRIVDFINTHISWNKELGRYGSSNYKKLFETKKGNAAVINLLLINLCLKAGLKAYPVLTKYRFYGLLNTNFPSLTEINYVFALVEIDGKEIFVDATSPYFEPGNLPLRALNVAGVLIKDEKSHVIPLTNTNLNYYREAGKYTINLDEKRLQGTGKSLFKGYATVKARKEFKEEEDDEDQQELIKDSDSEDNSKENIDDSDEEDDENDEEDDEFDDVYNYTSTKGYENKYGQISTEYTAQLYSPFEEIGDEIFVDAFVSLEFEKNPFLDEERKYPAFFNTMHHFNHIAILEFPEGYALKSKPENITMKIINGKGSFSYRINEAKDQITVNSMFKIENDVFMPEEYASLYAFFNQVLQKQKEKIVLVKEQ